MYLKFYNFKINIFFVRNKPHPRTYCWPHSSTIEKFKIGNKVVCIVTDNRKDIRKAARSMQNCARERGNARRLACRKLPKQNVIKKKGGKIW